MNEDFNGWREQIKSIDQEVIKLLEQRFQLVGKIGEFKKHHNLPIRDEMREKMLIAEMTDRTRLAPDFINDFYKTLFSYSYSIEQ